MTLGDGLQSVHFCRSAKSVYRQNCTSTRGDRFFHQVGIEIEFEGIDIHKDGRDAFVAENVCRGDKGEGGKNNFVAFLEAECANCEMKPGSAGGNAHGVLCAGVLGDCGFEGFELWAEAEAPAAQNLRDGGDFRVGNIRSRKRDSHCCGTARLMRSLRPSGAVVRTSTIFSAAVPSP